MTNRNKNDVVYGFKLDLDFGLNIIPTIKEPYKQPISLKVEENLLTTPQPPVR